MFSFKFDLPQVKRKLIFTVINFDCECPLELPNDLRPKIFQVKKSIKSEKKTKILKLNWDKG